jgi:hypothetical protein
VLPYEGPRAAFGSPASSSNARPSSLLRRQLGTVARSLITQEAYADDVNGSLNVLRLRGRHSNFATVSVAKRSLTTSHIE